MGKRMTTGSEAGRVERHERDRHTVKKQTIMLELSYLSDLSKCHPAMPMPMPTTGPDSWFDA